MNESFTHLTPAEPAKNGIAIRYGVITGFISIVYSLILNITDLAFTTKALTWISFVILIAGMVLAMREFKRLNNGFMSFGQGLGIGTLVAVISSVLGGIFTYIYVKFIDSGYLEKMHNMQISELEEKGMNDEQIEQAISLSQKMMTPEMMMVFAIVGGLVFGFLLSLVLSAIIKNTRPEFD